MFALLLSSTGDAYGITALMTAADTKDSDIEIVKILLANGAVPNQGELFFTSRCLQITNTVSIKLRDPRRLIGGYK